MWTDEHLEQLRKISDEVFQGLGHDFLDHTLAYKCLDLCCKLLDIKMPVFIIRDNIRILREQLCMLETELFGYDEPKDILKRPGLRK